MSRLYATRQSQCDIESIVDVYKQDSSGGKRILKRIDQLLDLIEANPNVGEAREDLSSGLRVISANPYVSSFRSRGENVELLGVLHGSRDWEGLFREGYR